MFQERTSGPYRLMWISLITLMVWIIMSRAQLMTYIRVMYNTSARVDERPLSDRELDLSRGWYGLKINSGPTSYHLSLRPLASLISAREITRVQLGDLICVERRSGSSALSVKSRGVLSARDLSALNIPISVNHSSAHDLTRVKGIGARRAQQIIQGRPWRSVSELTRIKGIGDHTVRRLKRHLTASARDVIWERGL